MHEAENVGLITITAKVVAVFPNTNNAAADRACDSVGCVPTIKKMRISSSLDVAFDGADGAEKVIPRCPMRVECGKRHSR